MGMAREKMIAGTKKKKAFAGGMSKVSIMILYLLGVIKKSFFGFLFPEDQGTSFF